MFTLSPWLNADFPGLRFFFSGSLGLSLREPGSHRDSSDDRLLAHPFQSTFSDRQPVPHHKKLLVALNKPRICIGSSAFWRRCISMRHFSHKSNTLQQEGKPCTDVCSSAGSTSLRVLATTWMATGSSGVELRTRIYVDVLTPTGPGVA